MGTVTDLKSNNFSTEDTLKETSLNIVDHNVIDPPKSTNNEDNQTKDIKRNSTLSTEIKAPIAKSSIVPGYIEKDEYYDDFDTIRKNSKNQDKSDKNREIIIEKEQVALEKKSERVMKQTVKQLGEGDMNKANEQKDKTKAEKFSKEIDKERMPDKESRKKGMQIMKFDLKQQKEDNEIKLEEETKKEETKKLI